MERSDGVKSGVGRISKCSASSDSNSVEIMILLTALTFDFHKIISALTTLLTILTQTPSLAITSLWGGGGGYVSP